MEACEELECDGQEIVKDERLESFYALPASSLQRQTIAKNSIVGFAWTTVVKVNTGGEDERTNQRSALDLMKTDHAGTIAERAR